jgi:hemolysin III
MWMHIQSHPQSNFLSFLKRTIAAQIHLLACFGAIVGLWFLLSTTTFHSTSDLVSCVIFGATGIFLFAMSTTAHFLSDGYRISPWLNSFLETIDHAAIYLFIAGTYTPFLLNVVRPPWQNILLIAIWTIAVLGIVYSVCREQLPRWAQHRFVYTGLFVAMGWVLIVRVGEVFERLDRLGAFLLVAGGISYTIGAVGYATKRPKLFDGVFGFHEIWHTMVALGFTFHYFMIFNFYHSV